MNADAYTKMLREKKHYSITKKVAKRRLDIRKNRTGAAD